MKEEIIKELLEEFDIPDTKAQEEACIKAIKRILDTTDMQGAFLIELRDFIIKNI